MRELLLSLILFANIAQAETLYDYRIVKVIDGDTVNVMVDFLPRELGNIISIRILGIDTPEMRGKIFLSNLFLWIERYSPDSDSINEEGE